ncbi:hypothetical protein BH11ARM2_BH11ARM2_32600 [soil metagenome]
MKAAIAFLAALCVASPAAAQDPKDTSARTLAVQQKMRELDLVIQILPLALKAEQIDPILSELEKIRADQKKILELEDQEMLGFETKLDKAIQDARDKGKYPPKDAMAESFNLLHTFQSRRALARATFIERIFKIVKANCDEGQLTVMEKSLEPKLIDPTFKSDDRDEKIRFFIRVVFLDGMAYDVLKREYLRLKKGGDPAKKTDG